MISSHAMTGHTNGSLATRATLLERLKDLDDARSWQDFYRTYRKLIFGFALKRGLTPIEAEEVVQETVITVARNLPDYRYDPERCAFKTWLLNATAWRIQDQLRKRLPGGRGPNPEAHRTDRSDTIQRLPAPTKEGQEALWDAEWREHLMDRAIEKLKAEIDEKTFQIFDLYVLKGWSGGEVARSLGVSRARVYLTKHRVTARLKKVTQTLSNSI